jgi:hypothetical protein
MWSGFEMDVDIHRRTPVGDVILLTHGVRLSDDVFPGAYRPISVRVLPFGIIWVGFVVNTLFHAFVWVGFFLLLTAPWAIRRSIRRRRGRCVACNYDLRSSGVPHNVCPECGCAELDARTSEAAAMRREGHSVSS